MLDEVGALCKQRLGVKTVFHFSVSWLANRRGLTGLLIGRIQSNVSFRMIAAVRCGIYLRPGFGVSSEVDWVQEQSVKIRKK
jgi:hypothetical protein